MALNLDKLREFLDSDEGQVAMENFAKKIDAHTKYRLDWTIRFNDFLEPLEDQEVDTLMVKFIEWEDKYQNMWYSRGIDTQSNILSILFATACEFGTEIECQEDFCATKVEYLGYVFTLYVGQGSIIGISKNGERIF